MITRRIQTDFHLLNDFSAPFFRNFVNLTSKWRSTRPPPRQPRRLLGQRVLHPNEPASRRSRPVLEANVEVTLLKKSEKQTKFRRFVKKEIGMIN